MKQNIFKDAFLKKINNTIDDTFPDHLERCRAFLRQKSVSSTGEGIRETGEWVGSWIEELGGNVTLWGDPSYPIVFGRLDRGKPKTLIVYGMYDVQPAAEANWVSPPFAAELHNLPGLGECVVARGAVNSKGALCGVFNALSSLTDKKENITIPKFYENVSPVSKVDLSLLKNLEKTFDEKAFLKEMKRLNNNVFILSIFW